MAPLGRRWRRRQQGRLQHGGQVQIEVLLGDVRQAEFESNHFPLLGGAETPGHRARRLRQNRRMRRATAPAHGAAATVEQQQFDLLLAADFHQAFLRAILRPGRCRGASILGRVGITDHHFLRALQPCTVTRQQQQPLHHRPGVVEVSEGFEQRHHAHWPQHARLFEQQLHGEHIRSSAGHGDHVGTERGARCGSDFLAGVEHFGGVSGRFEMRWQQWPTIAQFAGQEADALLFVPIFVATEAEVIGDFSHRRAVARRVLAHIQTHKEQAEGHRPTQAVEQRTISDHAHAALVQRVEAQLQRIEQIAVVVQHVCRRWRRCSQRSVCPIARGAQAFAQLFEHRTIRFGAVAGLGFEGVAGLLHRQFGCQMIDITQVQIGGHPARQQQHFASHRSGNVGVTITVAAHP
ncbi:hypothetical protein D3C72_747990 [compost metagenome]